MERGQDGRRRFGGDEGTARLASRARGVRAPLALLALALVPTLSRAEPPPPKESTGVPTPGRSIAATDDAQAIAVNPANVAFLPSAEARWTWVRTGDGSPLPGRGHSLDLGAPFFSLGAGLRADFVRPPPDAPAPFDDRYTWLRFALALRAGRSAALGVALARSHSDEPRLDDHLSLTTGLTVRPLPHLSLAAVARDWNRPTGALPGATIERSYDLGVALRPAGRRLFELGAETTYLEESERWVHRGIVGLDVPRIGRLRGDVTLLDPGEREFVATAGLDLHVGTTTAFGGGVFGDAVGRAGAGFYAGVALTGYREPGVRLPQRGVRITLDGTPGDRAHVRLLRRLWTLSADPEVAAVALVLRAEPAASLAHAEELADAVRLLRQRRKKVICHLEDNKGRSLYVCAHADRTVMNPAGGLRFAGLSSRYTYLAELLGKIGVRADFVRIGAHKGAAEQLTRSGPSEVIYADHADLLAQYEQSFVDAVAEARRMPAAVLRKRIATGPFLAREALEAGLIDGVAYEDELDSVVEEVVGRSVALVDLDDALVEEAPESWGNAPGIAVVYLAGDMVDGESRTVPLLGIQLAGSYTVAAALKAARESRRIRAVVLRVETGGGSSLAADVILREAILTARQKPLVVSMGGAAASGGYYAAVAGSPIYANATTLTGSIGIFYGKVDVAELMNRIGVHHEMHRSAPRADAESLYRPFTDDERRELGVKVKQFYDLFIARVATGRKMSPEAVDAVARGRVWIGKQAHARRLVDRLGGLRQALEEARLRGGLPADAPLVELPRESETLVEVLLDLVGARAAGEPGAIGPASLVPPALLEAARGLAPLLLHEAGKPLARAEWTVEPP